MACVHEMMYEDLLGSFMWGLENGVLFVFVSIIVFHLTGQRFSFSGLQILSIFSPLQ
jgi:hypothetical protein